MQPVNGGRPPQSQAALPLTVLVADDSAIMRSVITRVLRLTGLPLAEVLQAGDGAVALELLQQHPVDLALLDINMPRLSGIQILERVRSNPALAALAILIVSSDGADTRRQAVDANRAGFLHKPFTPEELRDKVLEVTGRDA